jgi:hypothetical protein
LLLTSSSGCILTNRRLRQSVVHQGKTLTELQYQQVLNNIAMLSLDPDALPSHVNLRDGSAQIQDNGSILSPSNLPTVSASRTVVEQWSLIPVADDTTLRVLQVAYRRALGYNEMPDIDLANDLAHDLCRQISNSDYIGLRSDPSINVAILNGAKIFDGLNQPDPREATIKNYLINKEDRLRYYQESVNIFEPRLSRLNVLANALSQLTIDSNDEVLVYKDEIEPYEGDPKNIAMDITTHAAVSNVDGRLYSATASPVVRETRRQIKQFYSDMSELHGGWFGVGPWRAVPRDAFYVGHYRGRYAWVCPGGRKDLASFTLKVLNFATMVKDPSITSVPGGPRFSPSVPTR